MFVVRGTFPIKPDSVGELRAALVGLQAATRAESGCLYYEWSESLETPGTFYSIETWESRDALEQHLTTGHVKAAVAALPGWLGGQPALVGYEAAEEIALPL
jgi:quinol monooxygenase YgiN